MCVCVWGGGVQIDKTYDKVSMKVTMPLRFLDTPDAKGSEKRKQTKGHPPPLPSLDTQVNLGRLFTSDLRDRSVTTTQNVRFASFVFVNWKG